MVRSAQSAAHSNTFIAADAARRAGLEVVQLADRLGNAARTAPAAAVAWLLAERLSSSEE